MEYYTTKILFIQAQNKPLRSSNVLQMKTTPPHHYGTFSPLSLIIIFFLLLHITQAQPDWGPTRNTNLYPYSRFSSSLAIIIAVLVTSLFFMVFFFIYIRYCTAPTSAVSQPLAFRSVVVARGLDASVIDSFPTFTYSEVRDHKIGKGALECAVCLNEFEDDETLLRLLPKCDHVFHPECIDAWLQSHVTCPVCRADLVPVHVPGPTGSINEDCAIECEDNVEMTGSRNDEIVIDVGERTGVVNRNLSFGNLNRPPVSRPMNRNISFGDPNRMARSWSMRRKMFGLGKLGRSRSAGNMLVQSGEDIERFTLRLPFEVRREVINRATLNRTRSFAPTSRGKDIRRSDREVKSDRWEFFTRALSMKLRSMKGVAETGESSGSTSNGAGSRTLDKLRSFNCLVHRASDETGLISDEPVKPTV